jgi:hypothetical protein
MPETPTKSALKSDGPGSNTLSGMRDQDASPQSIETPFTKAKRKAAPRDITHNEVKDDTNPRNLDANEGPLQPLSALGDPFAYSPQSLDRTGKAARTSAITTPGQQFAERLKDCIISSPTPKSRDHLPPTETIGFQPQQRETSPTPGRFNDRASLHLERESDLATKVLDLIRADNPGLKGSTELQIRHEIGLALDMGETKLRRHDAEISDLRKRVDELETMVELLT